MTFMPDTSAVAAATLSAAHAVSVPYAALERRGDGCALVFASTSWRHLQTWISLARELPASAGGEDGAGQVLDNVRDAACAFGSPALVLQQLRGQPAALSGELAPERPYAAVIWWTGGLQEAAGLTASILQRMANAHDGADGSRNQLRMLGAIADQARRRIAPLLDGLTDARTALLDANRALSEASARVGEMLLQRQDAVTGAHERVSRLERQLARLGLFNAHRKQAVVSRLHAMQRDRAAAMQREHCIEVQLRAFDALLDEGAWIGPALADALESLEKLRTAWTRFGSGMTQLSVEASDWELADPRWLERTLGLADAVRQWTALERAARDFMADLLPAGSVERV
ncbi:hypothetical protein Q4S45_07860 [Massilia sp. R2A-15]|uniref:hypothetical protein n=1 Tax=Massilia sp. R2A-15 TaxID=3064278 RepID=UPI0027352104|nr:hypothetical protein [Massilia sp. R2A-15]WLI91022.1 hypothetical protein Q4S45_07860 [Massilia sp. R2A-15]